MRAKLAALSLVGLLAFAFALPMHAGCELHINGCPKLSSAPLAKLAEGVPPFVFDGKDTYYVEMRDGKLGSDCFGVTFYRPQLGLIILADNMSPWHTRETLHHELSHVAAHTRFDGSCKFKNEDAAIEHLSPGWIDILRDSRNAKLVEYLTK